MKQRTYWLLPDLVSARRTMTDLLAAGVETRHIHFAARDGLDLTGLHAANVLQTSDVVHAAKTGLVLGSITGSCAGLLVALFFPIVGDGPQWEAAVVLAVLGGRHRRLVVQHDRHFHPQPPARALRKRHCARGHPADGRCTAVAGAGRGIAAAAHPSRSPFRGVGAPGSGIPLTQHGMPAQGTSHGHHHCAHPHRRRLGAVPPPDASAFNEKRRRVRRQPSTAARSAWRLHRSGLQPSSGFRHP